MFANALRMSHKLLEEVLQEGDIALDATMGNGNDTLFLSRQVGKNGHVYAFDVQEKALLNTRARLEKEQAINNVTLIQESHEFLARHVPEKLNGAIFNLGFLPKSDEKIITQERSTLPALVAASQKLLAGARLCIVLYYGHPGGLQEKRAVEKWCQNLSGEDFCVLRYEFYNQTNQPPILLCVEKKKKA